MNVVFPEPKERQQQIRNGAAKEFAYLPYQRRPLRRVAVVPCLIMNVRVISPSLIEVPVITNFDSQPLDQLDLFIRAVIEDASKMVVI